MHYLIGLIVVAIVCAGIFLYQKQEASETNTVLPASQEEQIRPENDEVVDGMVDEAKLPENAETEVIDTTPAENVENNTVIEKVSEVIPTNTVEVNNAIYQDGTYRADTIYTTPARKEYKIDVTLEIENDTVIVAKVMYSQGAEVDPNAQRFESAYRTLVLDKSLDDISLSRVGGASLTSAAFNVALAEIKGDAKL